MSNKVNSGESLPQSATTGAITNSDGSESPASEGPASESPVSESPASESPVSESLVGELQAGLDALAQTGELQAGLDALAQTNVLQDALAYQAKVLEALKDTPLLAALTLSAGDVNAISGAIAAMSSDEELAVALQEINCVWTNNAKVGATLDKARAILGAGAITPVERSKMTGTTIQLLRSVTASAHRQIVAKLQVPSVASTFPSLPNWMLCRFGDVPLGIAIFYAGLFVVALVFLVFAFWALTKTAKGAKARKNASGFANYGNVPMVAPTHYY